MNLYDFESAIKICGTGLLLCHNLDGSFAWKRTFKNGVTLVGLDYLASVGFTAGSQVPTWYIGLIDVSGFTALSQNDTMASHSWSENTLYSGNRATWVNTESGQTVSSNGPFSFPITGNGTIKGLFATSSSTKGGNSGTLWATAVLNQNADITTGQTLTGTYTISFAGN